MGKSLTILKLLYTISGALIALLCLEVSLEANIGVFGTGIVQYMFLGLSITGVFIGVHLLISGISSIASGIRGEGEPWTCTCPICKAIVRPILYKFSPRATLIKRVKLNPQPPPPIEEEHPQKVEEGFPEETREVKTEEKPQVTEPTPPPPPVEPQSTQTQQSRNIEDVIAPLSEAAENLKERILFLEEELNNIKQEFKLKMDEIREALVNLKVSISEAKNPIVKAINPTAERMENSKNDEGNPGQPSTLQTKLTPAKYIRIMKWIDSMLDKTSKTLLLELVKSYMQVNIIDKETGDVILRLIEIVDKLKNSGISVAEQIMNLYSLARTLESKDADLSTEILKLIEEGKV